MRKDSAFEVKDRINIYFSGSNKINDIFVKFADEIKTQTLADEIQNQENDGKEWDINGEKVIISVEKV